MVKKPSVIYLFKSGSVCDESTSEDVDGVEEIHSVATINNVQTSYFTQLKMCYLMTQERSGLFHSWYTDPSLQGKGEQCKSQVSHTDHTMEEKGALKMTDMKLQDVKLTDGFAGHEIAGHENGGPNSRT